MSSRRTLALLMLIVVAGAAIRGSRLDESLWYDEIAAWHNYGSQGPEAIVGTYYDPANHIAHTLLTWCSVKGLPSLSAERALRLPALLFSLASIIAVFVLARLAVDDDGPGAARAGLLAATLTAILPVSVLEGAEARGYSMMIFFAAASTAAWCSVLNESRGRRLVVYAACCALGIWAHPMTVFVPLGHAAWLAATTLRSRNMRAARFPALALGAAAALTLLLYAPVVGDVLRVRRLFAGSSSAGPTLFGLEGLHLLLQLGGSWSWWIAIPGLAVAMLGAQRARHSTPARHVVTGALAGLPLLLIAVLLSRSWIYARFGLFALPGAIVLMALGLDAMWRRDPRGGFAGLALLIAGAAVDLSTRPSKQPLRDAARHVQSIDPTARVLVVGLRHEVLDVYRGDLDLRYSLQHGADLVEKLAAVDPEFVVVLYVDRVAPEQLDRLREEFDLDESLPGWVDWGAGRVDVYRRRD